MVQIKTAELQGVVLDYCVAKCEGLDYNRLDGSAWTTDAFTPSADWAQGGPIIEREVICINSEMGIHWFGMFKDTPLSEVEGNTPLQAAMRCYVASKLGDVVEAPDSLVQ